MESSLAHSLSHLTLLAIEAALQAGDLLRHGFGTKFSVKSKEGKHNLVTEHDIKAEKQILDFLTSQVPDSQFLAEESGESQGKSSLVWIVDPLDGTVNFAHQIPVFSVSIALEKEGKLHTGVVYQPITHELFVAEKGKGATLNGEPISVTKTTELSQAILATGFPYDVHKNPHHCIEHFGDILREGIPIRRLGSAAIDLAYTAAGRLDGFFEVGLKPWDCAAGLLLLQEAKGHASTWDGSPFSYRKHTPILATNGHIHKPLSTLLTRKVS